ncbi:hypothetical protein BBJ28_00000080 [Nothophytophthora sp. Chile5]|nr:hypothetical protein BBJ28_00000080 [Nothophytophthora sp. Chile5]
MEVKTSCDTESCQSELWGLPQALLSQFQICGQVNASMVFNPVVVSAVGISTQRQVDALYAPAKYFTKEQCHRVAISTGITVEYAVHTTPSDGVQQPSRNERVVLITGLMQPKDTWATLIDTLLSDWNPSQQHATLSILSMDNRGFGGTDAPFWRYTTRQMAQDTLALMDHLGWDAGHFVGVSDCLVSLGGMIIQELALLAPERVRSLTLISTTRGKYKADPRWRGPMMRNICSLTPAAKTRSVLEMSFPDEFLETRILETGDSLRTVLSDFFESQVKSWPRPGLGGFLGQGLAAQTHFVSDERLREINDAGFPVLIVSGMLDIIIPAAESITLKEHMDGDHVRTLFFDTGGHGAGIQFPDEVTNAFLETIARASSPRA